MSSKLSKNIEEQADSCMDYHVAMNQNGSGFVNTMSCPILSFSGTNSGSTYTENIATDITLDTTVSYCSWSSTIYPGQQVRLDYSADYQTFSSITYRGDTKNLTGTSSLQATLGDIDSSLVSLNLGAPSGIDANWNSDNYQNTSTGWISYPGNYLDDDDLARKITYGYIRKDGLWRNIFWNTDTSAQKIRKNSNNTGSLVIFPDQTVSGMLRLDLNSSYNLKIVEINSELYKESKEIRILNSINSTSNTGAIGYLQNDLSVSSNTANAKLFNLKENNYAIFLSSTGTTADFLKYKYYFTNQTGSIIYTVPLDDSLPDQMAYYGNTIIIDTDGSYIGKEQEFIRPK